MRVVRSIILSARVWLANCYFTHDSSGFPALLPFFDAPSGGHVLVELNVVVILFCEKDRLIAGVCGHLLGDARYFQFTRRGRSAVEPTVTAICASLKPGAFTRSTYSSSGTFLIANPPSSSVGRRGEGLGFRRSGQHDIGIRHNRAVGALDDSPHGSCVLGPRIYRKYKRQEKESVQAVFDHRSSRLSLEVVKTEGWWGDN